MNDEPEILEPQVVIIDGVERPDVNPGDTTPLDDVLVDTRVTVDFMPDIAALSADLGVGVTVIGDRTGPVVVVATSDITPEDLSAAVTRAGEAVEPTPLERLAASHGLTRDEMAEALREATATS